jgi:hypothetical protein
MLGAERVTPRACLTVLAEGQDDASRAAEVGDGAAVAVAVAVAVADDTAAGADVLAGGGVPRTVL